MTIKNLYPKSRPQTIYNVINGRPELPAASTFKRESIGTYVDAGGIIRTAAADKPRFNYDLKTGEFLGLLLETERTNYFRNSETLTPSTALPDGTTVTLESGISNPLGQAQVPKLGGGKDRNAAYMQSINSTTSPQSYYTFSCYAKSDPAHPCPYFQLRQYGRSDSGQYAAFVTFDTTTGEITAGGSDILAYSEDAGNGWRRYVITGNGTLRAAAASTFFYLTVNRDGYPDLPFVDDLYMYIVGAQMEATPGTGYVPSSVIVTPTGAAVTRKPDEFSLTTSTNFDSGFSLLLDSDVTSDDFLYKIKASGTTIAYLGNDNGTLDWNVNGTSAANSTPPLYPQVGAIQPGRVRTVSSFGAADGTIQNNYLYTTGLSFPTPAVVGSSADEIEFGVPQTLKALYLWPGQLGNTEAVSVIKGKYNVVPIDTDDITNPDPGINPYYSFVYNCDPTNEGNTEITLPYIVPTKSMRIYWGDGDKGQRYEQGVTPKHTYPYPGQYRIKIDGEEDLAQGGKRFDNVRLGTGDKIINRVDQWAPQHRVGASGSGFTGDEMDRLLISQVDNKLIPPFKYTDITTLEYTFYNQQYVQPNGWDWVPTQCQKVVSTRSCYRAIALQTRNDQERRTFPQMITSDKLVRVNGCFDFGPIGWVDKDNNPTLFPWTNTSMVFDWSYTFSNSGITEIGNLDMGEATTTLAMFQNCNKLTEIPYFNFNKLVDASNMFRSCSSVTSISTSLDFSTVTDLRSAFRQMEALPSFPSNYNFENVRLAGSAWRELFSCKSLPNFNLPSCLNMSEAFYNCRGLTSFPIPTNTNLVTNWNYCWGGGISIPTAFPNTVDISGGDDFYQTWQSCRSLTTFPADLDFTNANRLSGAWLGCNGLTSFPVFTKPPVKLTLIDQAWANCKKLPSFPAVFSYANVTNFNGTWQNCEVLTDFEPNQFDTTGTLVPSAFANTWKNCALTAQSIENILVSLVENGQSNIILNIDDGNNEDYKDWTATAKDKYAVLVRDRGWDIDINDSTNVAPFTMSATSGFYVNSQDGVVSFGELTPGSRHASGKANQEVIADEGKAIDRVLELDENFFPDWDRGATYMVGDRVKFGNYVYRALQENDMRSFELPDDLEFNPDAEVATPANRQARWVEVYDPNYEEESIGGSI